jgi:hypothetical protein
MAREEYDAAYIGSNDYWAFDSDSFNEDTKFFGKAWIVDSADITPEKIAEDNLHRCQMYYEVGKTDNHLFTPTNILYDNEAEFLMIRGKQGRIGQPQITADKTRVYAIGEKAQRYKNLTDGPEDRTPARFTVNYIVVDNEEGKEKIKEFIEEIDGDGQEVAQAEEVLRMKSENEYNAEEYDAENLNRINPVVVEGAEDVHGAEEFGAEVAEMVDYDQDGMANSEVFGEFVNDNVIGQDFNGQVIGQNAEGFEAQGYNDRMDESMGMTRPEGGMKQSYKARRDESKGMEKAMGRRAYQRVGTMDAEMAEMVDYDQDGMANSEVFGEFVNDNVIGQDFNGQVIGQNAEGFEPQQVFGVVGEGQDFGQDMADVYWDGEDSYDYNPESFSPYDDPESYSPYMDYDADDVVEFVQDLPLINRFNLNGWAASGIVVAVAALSGAWFSKR